MLWLPGRQGDSCLPIMQGCYPDAIRQITPWMWSEVCIDHGRASANFFATSAPMCLDITSLKGQWWSWLCGPGQVEVGLGKEAELHPNLCVWLNPDNCCQTYSFCSAAVTEIAHFLQSHYMVVTKTEHFMSWFLSLMSHYWLCGGHTESVQFTSVKSIE